MTTRVQYADKTVTANGLKLHYLEWGDPTAPTAPTIITLHGFRGHGHSWDSFSEPMSKAYRILALDQRGRGDSQWAPDGDYTSDAYVKDLEGFCQALRLEPFILVGHSMGGRNAILFAGQHPDIVSKLVIVDIGPERDPRSAVRIKQDLLAAREEYDSFEELFQLKLKDNTFISQEVLRRRLTYETTVLADGKVRWRYDLEIRQQWREDRLPPGEDMWPILLKIPCPTLIVRGRETDTLPLDVAQRMVEVMPRAQLAHVERATHMVMEDNPDEFLHVVRAFLDAPNSAG